MKGIAWRRYLDELQRWKDSPDVVKVIIGARRSGKSVTMQQFIRRIEDPGVDPSLILYMNLESSDHDDIIDYRSLNSYIPTVYPVKEGRMCSWTRSRGSTGWSAASTPSW